MNVNITLLFSLERYEEAVDAYLRGLAARAERGEPLAGIASVASFFLSRIDTKVDALLPRRSPLRGRVAIASARVAHQHYLQRFADSSAWQRLGELGARPQRLLWASTGTKDPKASDTLYVEALAAPDTINTIPDKTLVAFAEHGRVGQPMRRDGGDCEQVIARFRQAGIDDAQLAEQLQREGKESFDKSWNELLKRIAGKAAQVSGGRSS